MMCAYDEIYLADAMENLGECFDYAVNACELDADEFMKLFLASGIAEHYGSGNPRYVSGMSGTELAMEIIDASGLSMTFPVAQIEYDYSPDYWCGWILAYYQWKSGRSFRDISGIISMADILKLYSTLHEAPEDKFVETVDAMAAGSAVSDFAVSKLQFQRKISGYSQRELAEKSGVNLRTLQQYEVGAKDIRRASVQSVVNMAQVMGCGVEDIIE